MTPSSSLREEARALAGQGHALADRPASPHSRPAPPCGSGGEPSIPSDDAGGAKMGRGRTPGPGRALRSGGVFPKSSRAAVITDEQIEAELERAWFYFHGCSIETTLTNDTNAMKRKMRRAA